MRVSGKGILGPARPVSFTFDGRPLMGLEGDTLASALLANDIRLVGRSFKYHRPRGIMTAGPEEPNALVTIGSGAAQDPNIRATVQELHDGLEACSQNRWPHLRFDLLSVNDLAAPFFGAGFYYKTFMWPRAFWERLYEPLIRRSAGLGALSGSSNADPYEKAFAFCDLLVIGGGPTGLMAALTAARAGADVILADEDYRLGGRLLAETHEVDGQPGHIWAAAAAAEFGQMPNVRIMTRTTITSVHDHGTYGALERVGHHLPRRADLPRECFWRIHARRAVLCAGAIERTIAFADNDRPGIMTAGSVRAYLNRWGVSPGRKVAVLGNNDDAHRTARDLSEAGVEVAALIDTRPDAQVTATGSFAVMTGASVLATRGRHGLRSITLRHQGEDRVIEADCLAVSGGWNPSVHLTCHLNGRPAWDEGLAAFLPVDGAVPGLTVAGAARGAFSTAACLDGGARAAVAALDEIGIVTTLPPLPVAEDDPTRIAAIWSMPGKGRAWLDYQNDVTVKDVRQSAAENFRSVEHMKRYTTQGMAPDQGKNSNVAALAILADATGRGIAETGTTTFRPPFTPVAIAAMGAGGQGMGFAPQRFTTSHQAGTERGAPMIEAGMWYRPSYFPKPGESHWRQSCDREVLMVRSTVGVVDVSTLGKIDIQGPGAASLLDFVYTNTFSSLPVGKVRYGLMLREDGFVMDDGTTARMGQDHYVMTTTTAAAGQVMRHLDFVTQGLHPEWDVQVVSVTEQWAQFAVAGPRSRELISDVLDAPLGDFPFMACGPVSVLGVAGRLFRITFSGEQAYEIAVPARYGAALYRLLVAQAEAMGGGAYGMEALNVLRIEKGFITHAEIHGRTTAFDIGMEAMVSKKKDCMGFALSRRPGLLDEGRERLVGLRPVDPGATVTAGAHLFDRGATAIRENDQGYVTSVCWSPVLNSNLALGFLRRGPQRLGEVVRLVDHLRGVETLCTVVNPVFLDPEGGRMRG